MNEFEKGIPGPRPVSPEIIHRVREYIIPMRWDNTRIHTYAEGGGAYNHVFHTFENGNGIAFRPEPHVYEQLITADFPIIRAPLLDEQAYQFMVEQLQRDAEAIIRPTHT